MVTNPLRTTLVLSATRYLARMSGIDADVVGSHVTLDLLPEDADGRKKIARLIVRWNCIEAKRSLASKLRPAIHRLVADLESIDIPDFKVVPEWGDRQFSSDLCSSRIARYCHPDLGGQRIAKDGKYRRWVSFVAENEDVLVQALSRVLAAPVEPIRTGRRQKDAGLREPRPV